MGLDPAFLFYPADASEDTQCMNRLERGCYFDLLKAQKKYEKFTIEQIQKILGKDFDACWTTIELTLKKEGEYYFISWVKDSIDKRKAYSASRRENKSKRKQEHMTNISSTYDKDMTEISESHDNHMGNGNEIINKEKESENFSEDNFPGVKVTIIPDKKPVKPKKPLTELTYPFDTETFRAAWKMWTDYKKEAGEAYTTLAGEQMQLSKLKKFNEEFSIKLIEESISREWSGLVFKETEAQYEKYKSTAKTHPQKSMTMEEYYKTIGG